MKRLFGVLLALSIVFSSSAGHGGVGGIPIDGNDERDDYCVPDFPPPLKPGDPDPDKVVEDKGALYSFQVPFLFRNEITDQDFWVYARACVSEKDASSRVGLGYSNLNVIVPEAPSKGIWQFQDTRYSFAPERSDKPGDDFRVFKDSGSLRVYIPYPWSPVPEKPSEADTRIPKIGIAQVQDTVMVGISDIQKQASLPEVGAMSMKELLEMAGFVYADYATPPVGGQRGGAWVEYSLDPDVRTAYGDRLQRPQYAKAWLNARYLLCDMATRQPRGDVNLAFARTLMARAPAFDGTMAESLDCSNPFKDNNGAVWKWAGGIGAFYLFPNLTMRADHVFANGQVAITGSLLNKSPGSGPVYIFYRWGIGQPWQLGVRTEIASYQGYHGTPVGAPFTFSVTPPGDSDTLQVFAAPGMETGLARANPDPSPGNSGVRMSEPPQGNLPYVADAWNYYEHDWNDNFYERNITCGDLRVELSAAEEGSPAGFEITATAIRDGCPDLTSVPVDINIDGQKQRGTAYFNGKTATVSFFSGPKEPGVVSIRGWVDPLNAVPETNETNNGDTIAVVVSQPTGWPTWTTPGTGPVTDPDSLQCPDDIPQEKCFSTRITK
ncbi:MAG TPA: hypothetical protein VNT75_06755 [Symbiobacteriaceae bacterium]|nr:hypothetical protein [Symbiobacteriaceae bacterium]